MADRLVIRDREQDDRRTCLECATYRPGRCGNHRRALLNSPDLARDLAALLQHCPGFEAAQQDTCQAFARPVEATSQADGANAAALPQGPLQ